MIDFDFIEAEIRKIDSNFDRNFFNNKSILITGATGLIGSSIIRYLSFIKKNGINVEIFAIARNQAKVEALQFDDNIAWFFEYPKEKFNVDYVIHAASPTESSFFANMPVETIIDSFNLFLNLINNLRDKLNSFIFLSSMEIYGNCLEDRLLKEDESFGLVSTIQRNSYPEVKKLLECLCSSLAIEKLIPIKIVRLCQTFGPGVSITDNRVFAQFAKSIVEKTDIILSTKGETKRSYCSIADSILGILYVLKNGKNGEAYNVSSDDSYCSIYDMAKMFTSGTTSKVIINECENSSYLGTIKFGLDISKIKALGFKPTSTLKENIATFIEYYKTLY